MVDLSIVFCMFTRPGKPPFSYGFPMVFLWFSYGFPMVFLWFSYGFPMVFLWFSYGFPMVFLWLSYGFPMVFLWFSYGFPMVFLWFSYGSPVIVAGEIHSSVPPPWPRAWHPPTAPAVDTSTWRWSTSWPPLDPAAASLDGYRSRLSTRC